MKKFWKYFSTLLLVLILITGCGEKKKEETKKDEEEKVDALEVLTSAREKMNTIESFSYEISSNVEITIDGSVIAMGLSSIMHIDENGNTHEITENTVLGETTVEEEYSVVYNEKLYVYSSDDEYWYYDIYEIEETEEDTSQVEDIIPLEENFTDIKQEKTDREGYIKISANMNAEMFKQVVEQSYLEAFGEEIETSFITEDFKYNFYIKDGYICFIEIDASEFLSIIYKNLMSEYIGLTFDENAEVIVKAPMVIELYNFNEVEPIELPEELIDEDGTSQTKVEVV